MGLKPHWHIRPEGSQDQAAIYELTRLAFASMEHAAGDEQDLIDALRARGALSLSLVAEQDNAIIGHVAFSPVTNSDGAVGWFGLGPVSVRPSLQRKGVGTALIKAGLSQLRADGAAGCILVGHLDYYPRFGFQVMPQLAPKREPADHFMVLAFGGPLPLGRFAFHPAFYEET